MSFSKRYAKNKSKNQSVNDQSKKQACRLDFTQAPVKDTAPIKWRSILLSALMIIVVSACAFIWHYRDQMLFPVKHIDVQGHFDQVKAEALQAVFARYASGSMLLLSERQLKQALLQVPLIDQVSLQRVWPSTLQIVLEQKHPVARFGKEYLLSDQGVLFMPEAGMHDIETLPYIEGPNDRANQLWQAYVALNKILLPLKLSIARLYVSPRLSYSLVLNNGLTIYLGSVDIAERLALFVRVYPKSLYPRLDEIEYIDMRYNSAMAVAWKAVNKKP